jgi:hypothetical protein
MTVTLETIHKDILSLKREFGGAVSYFEEDKMELSEEIKKTDRGFPQNTNF